MVSFYLASTFTKYKLDCLAPKYVKDGYIQLNFAPPVHGIPSALISTRVYYRTLPHNIAGTHLPFWRAKGFLKLDDAYLKPSLTSWSSGLGFHNNKIKLVNNNCSMKISVDFAKTKP